MLSSIRPFVTFLDVMLWVVELVWNCIETDACVAVAIEKRTEGTLRWHLGTCFRTT